MHYFLCLVRVGFYATRFRDDEAIIIVREGRVLDATSMALNRGIDRDMPLSSARTIYPEARVEEWRAETYEQEARAWLDRLIAYSGSIERVDQHHAFVDLSDHVDPESIAGRILDEIPDARFGVGGSRWVAELMTNAPATLSLADVDRMLPNFPTKMLSVVSPESRERLVFLGYSTIGAIRTAPSAALNAQFGREGLVIEKSCRGRSFQPLRPNYPSPTLSMRTRFDGGTEDAITLNLGLAKVASELGRRLIEDDRRSSRLGLYVEFDDGTIQVLERELSKPAFSYASCMSPLQIVARKIREGSIVGLRVTLFDLERNMRVQRTFAHRIEVEQRERTIQSALRDIKRNIGESGVVLGSEVITPRRILARKQWERALGLDG